MPFHCPFTVLSLLFTAFHCLFTAFLLSFHCPFTAFSLSFHRSSVEVEEELEAMADDAYAEREGEWALGLLKSEWKKINNNRGGERPAICHESRSYSPALSIVDGLTAVSWVFAGELPFAVTMDDVPPQLFSSLAKARVVRRIITAAGPG